ncbi:MAG: helix-turn-helix transcriptional regulator [Verrucomicrobiaceae bacterium]|nr:helix-turn-helix transcriptional regulator [Verrucomicrobiaceae bacterium]
MALRKERQWSMEEVERRCGVKRQTLSALEHFQSSATLATALKLGRGFCGDLVPILERSRRWLHALVLPLISLDDLPILIGC